MDVMKTVMPQQYHLKNCCIVNIIFNAEHSTMETLHIRDIILINHSFCKSLTLNKFATMAILAMIYLFELVDIIDDAIDDLIH